LQNFFPEGSDSQYKPLNWRQFLITGSTESPVKAVFNNPFGYFSVINLQLEQFSFQSIHFELSS